MDQLNRVIQVIKKTYPQANVNSETRFLEDLQVDSISFIELIIEFEKEFDISIKPNDIENIQTVGELIDLI
jgi:acyl carrier protein